MVWFLFALLSSVFLTFQKLVQKKVLFHEHAAQYMTVLSLSATVLMLPFVRFLDFELSREILSLIFIKGLLIAVGWTLVFKVYRHMELSSAEPLRNLSPFFLLFLSYFFLGEVLSLKQFIGVAVILLGGYFLELHEKHGSLKNPLVVFKGRYTHFMLLSLVIFSVTAVMDKFILRATNVFTVMFLSTFFVAIIALIMQIIFYRGFKDIAQSLRIDGKWIAIIVILYLMGDFAYFSAVAMPGAMISLIIPLRRTATLFVTFFGGKLYHEHHVLRKTVSCLVMLIGVYLIVI